MPTYNDISSTTINAGSPITTQLVTRLNDNPVAVAEDDVTSPEKVIKYSNFGTHAAGDITCAGYENKKIRVSSGSPVVFARFNVGVTATYKFASWIQVTGSSNHNTGVSLHKGSDDSVVKASFYLKSGNNQDETAFTETLTAGEFYYFKATTSSSSTINLNCSALLGSNRSSAYYTHLLDLDEFDTKYSSETNPNNVSIYRFTTIRMGTFTSNTSDYPYPVNIPDDERRSHRLIGCNSVFQNTGGATSTANSNTAPYSVHFHTENEL